MTKMPMGWCYAPYIAQETSNFVTRGIGYAWVDNFIIGGASQEVFDRARTTLRERLVRYDILVDDDSLMPTQHPCMLGIEFDLVQKKFRLDPAWIEKKTERLQKAVRGDWTACHSATFSRHWDPYLGNIRCKHATVESRRSARGFLNARPKGSR